MNEEKELSLTVASSPHAKSPVSTRNLMLDVCIALVPALCIGIFFFGPRALSMTVVSMAACGIFEFLYRKLLKKPNTTSDMSAMVTGILLAFVCPVTLPYYMLIIGDFFAIILVKQLFGGLGQNFMNPALAGRAFLMLSYGKEMATWIVPGSDNWAGLMSGSVTMAGADIVAGPTPLSTDFMHAGLLPQASLMDAFVGNVGGCLGEVSALMLLLGGIYLVIRGVIRVRIPVAFIGTVAVLTFLFPQGGADRLTWMLYSVLSGGLMLGAFFMATDYVTSPCTPKGELIFGVGCGLLTVFIRYYGGFPEGVSYAILIMNVCAWLIDSVAKQKRFGETAAMRRAAKKGGKA